MMAPTCHHLLEHDPPRACGAAAPWRAGPFSYCDAHKPHGSRVFRIVSRRESDLDLLEARAREMGLYLDDREHYGAGWYLVLLQRVDGAIAAREATARLENRRARDRGVV